MIQRSIFSPSYYTFIFIISDNSFSTEGETTLSVKSVNTEEIDIYIESSGVMVDAGVGEVGRVCPALGTRVVAVGHGAALGDQGARVAVQVHTRAGVRVPL